MLFRPNTGPRSMGAVKPTHNCSLLNCPSSTNQCWQKYPPHAWRPEFQLVIPNSAKISPILNTREISSTETLVYISHIRFLDTLHTFNVREFLYAYPGGRAFWVYGYIGARNDTTQQTNKSNEAPNWLLNINMLMLICYIFYRTHVPVAAVLVLNNPDDGRLRPKHVEWLCRSKICTVLHQAGVSLDLYYDARKHKIKKKSKPTFVWVYIAGTCGYI